MNFKNKVMSLATVLMTLLVFSFSSNSWTDLPPTRILSQSALQIATMSKTEAVTKNIEGKAQEAIGNMTGDPKNKMMGKAKQAESKVRNVKEAKKLARSTAKDMKEKINVKETIQDMTEAVEDKLSGMKNK
jgi:uncharacterized protein YjbJ (UPF0337 family)